MGLSPAGSTSLSRVPRLVSFPYFRVYSLFISVTRAIVLTGEPIYCSQENPNETDVELTTAPDANGATHWGQQAFYLSPGISAADGAVIEGRLEMQRKKENQRLYDVRLTWRQGDGDTMNDAVGERQNVWHIE